MEKIKIGYNNEAERKHKIHIERITKLVREFFELIEKYIEPEDKNAFKPNLYAHFIWLFTNKYSEKFPLGSPEKIADFMDVPIQHLKKLSTDIGLYNDIEVDFNTLVPKPIDFSIYAESEEHIKKVRELQPLLKVLNEYRKTNHVFHFDICKGANNAIKFQDGEFVINPNYILYSHRSI